MDFLEKLNLLMKDSNLNKNSLSKLSGIPYTTIDGWFKKGYESMQLSTLKKLSKFFETSLDFWANDNINDPSYGKTNDFKVKFSEMQAIKKYRILDFYGRDAVDTILDIEHKRCLETNISSQVKCDEQQITLVAARGDSNKAVNIKKSDVEEDTKNYIPPDDL